MAKDHDGMDQSSRGGCPQNGNNLVCNLKEETTEFYD